MNHITLGVSHRITIKLTTPKNHIMQSNNRLALPIHTGLTFILLFPVAASKTDTIGNLSWGRGT